MQDLRVIGVEDGSLLVATDDGTRFRIDMDEVSKVRLRQRAPEPRSGRKLAPREIQAAIRGGMSAEDVATTSGVSLEYIQKFEGAVLAEREYVVESALAVPVHTALETDPLAQGATFGSVIQQRLYDLGATEERWASWKEASGWVVKLSFTANQIDHDARWGFDPKKRALDPQNGEAVTLSQQGETTGVLIPRLRAVHPDERHPDATRFDSGAFEIAAAAPEPEVVDSHNSTQPLPDLPSEMNQTADLLDALRRRRGERETASFEDDAQDAVQQSTGIRIVDIPLDMLEDEPAGVPQSLGTHTPAGQSSSAQSSSAQSSSVQPPHSSFLRSSSPPSKSGRKGRQSMPSWDEIVFGARSDDDLG